MSKKAKFIFWNIVGCVVFLSLPLLFAPGRFTIESLLRESKTQQEFLSYLLLVVFYYLNLYFFIPRYFREKRYGKYAFIAFISLCLVVLVPALTIRGAFCKKGRMEHMDGRGWNQEHFHHEDQDGPPDHRFEQGPDRREGGHGPEMGRQDDNRPHDFGPPHGDWPHHGPDGDGPPHRHHHGIIPSLFELSHELFLLLVIMGFSLLYEINNQLKKIREEKLSSEISYLKAQINPHFLFNTLNSIYSLAIQKSDLAPIAVVKLSAIMRYVTSDAQKDKVSLEKELNYMLDYIDLQKMRFGETLNLNYKVNGSWANKQIAPLLLVPFVANAFKHGVNPEKESSVNIEVTIEGMNLIMQVDNAILNMKRDDQYEGGLGLENTKNRLQLLYPGKHVLRITETQTDFSLYLKIDLSV